MSGRMQGAPLRVEEQAEQLGGGTDETEADRNDVVRGSSQGRLGGGGIMAGSRTPDQIFCRARSWAVVKLAPAHLLLVVIVPEARQLRVDWRRRRRAAS